jgi:hypothetical protein
LYKLAAAENLPCAQFNLGFMYQRGLGVQQDMTEAIRLYELAAAQGDDDARCSLAHAREYAQFVRTYSVCLSLYVATAHVVATNRLRRLNPVHLPSPGLAMMHGSAGCSQSFAVLNSIEVTRAAKLRVCSSGWALSVSLRLARGKAAASCSVRRVECDVASVICARVLGRRSIIVKVLSLCAMMQCNLVMEGA